MSFGFKLILLLRVQQRCCICATHCRQSWSPGANQLTYISLDCVSGRLLDKDHNMTLFLFCAGSVNRRKAPAAQHTPVQDIDHRSQTYKTSQACQGNIIPLSFTLKTSSLFWPCKASYSLLMIRFLKCNILIFFLWYLTFSAYQRRLFESEFINTGSVLNQGNKGFTKTYQRLSPHLHYSWHFKTFILSCICKPQPHEFLVRKIAFQNGDLFKPLNWKRDAELIRNNDVPASIPF